MSGLCYKSWLRFVCMHMIVWINICILSLVKLSLSAGISRSQDNSANTTLASPIPTFLGLNLTHFLLPVLDGIWW